MLVTLRGYRVRPLLMSFVSRYNKLLMMENERIMNIQFIITFIILNNHCHCNLRFHFFFLSYVHIG